MSSKAERYKEILDIVCENVGYQWKELAFALNLTQSQVKELQQSTNDAKQLCWLVLATWKSSSKSTTGNLEELIRALKNCHLGRVADLVTKLCYSKRDIDEILKPHVERERKMQEAICLVTDSVSKYWRQLASKLGLSKPEVASIEGKHPDARTREKCMTALYKWRSIVVLQEYKVASIMLALRECRLFDVAADLQEFSHSGKVLRPQRNRHKGEAWLSLKVGHMEMMKESVNGEADLDVKLDGDDFEHLSICTASSEATSLSSQAQSKEYAHLRLSLTKQDMQDYVLTKIVYRLQDDLESQTRDYPHPLIQYLDDMGIFLNYVSRPKSSLLVQFADKESLNRLQDLNSDELSSIVTDCLISDEILNEIGIIVLKLNVNARGNDLQKCSNEFHM